MKKILFHILITVVGIFTAWLTQKELWPSIFAVIFVGNVFYFIYYKLDRANKPEFQKNLILAGGIAVTVISWFVTGFINNQNEINRNKLSINQSILQSRRDLKIKFLLDAYFRLENSDFRDTAPPGNKRMHYDYLYMKYAESALTSIQLLTSDSTIKKANLYVKSGGKDGFSPLLVALRDELRQELNLSQLPNDVYLNPTVFRTFRKNNSPDTLTREQEYQLIIKLNEFERGLIK